MPSRTTIALTGLLLLGSLSASWAQEAPERPDPREEVARLEALLRQVEGALAKLEPVTQPPTSWVEYDLRALFQSAPDRPAPRLVLATPDAGDQTAAGGGFTFEDGDETGYGLDVDQVEELITAAFLPAHPARYRIVGGFLHLETSAANHALTRQVIEELRRERLRFLQVEVGVYSLPADFQTELEEAALAADGVLTPQVLQRLDAAVEGGRGSLIDAALLSARSGQRVYFHRGIERSYVARMESSSGGTGQIVETVADPVMAVLRTGLALDVSAAPVGEGKGVKLDLRAARAELISVGRRSTPFGVIDVPRLHVSSTRTTTRLAPGSGVLVSASREAARPATKPGEAEQAARSILIVVRPR